MAAVRLDGVDDDPGVQCQADFASLDQLVAERGQTVGRLDRHHPHLASARFDRRLGGIGGDRTTADDHDIAAAREILRHDVVRADAKELHR